MVLGDIAHLRRIRTAISYGGWLYRKYDVDIDNSPEGSGMKRTAGLVSRSSLGILVTVMALLAVACRAIMVTSIPSLQPAA